MPEEIAPARFHEVGWRVLAYAASVHFRTASFAEGLRLADAIGGPADESGIAPTSTCERPGSPSGCR